MKGVDDRMATNTEKKKIENGIEALENISKEAIKENFDINIIYNQMCVLAVSTLSAWIEDQFKDCFFDEKIVKNYEKADIKITIKELSEKYNFEIKEKMGEILLEKDQDINFQDLQSILRTYKKYFEHEIAIKEECKNHIILYQQIRHALVHTGGTIDARFLSLVAKGGVCTEYKVGEKIALGKED